MSYKRGHDKMLCLSSHKVFFIVQESVYTLCVFCQRTLPLPHPLLANWHQQWISCLLAHGQSFQKILCKTVNPFRKNYAPFCDRTFLFPNPLLANWHEPNVNESWGQERLIPLTHILIHLLPDFSLFWFKMWPWKGNEVFVDRSLLTVCW